MKANTATTTRLTGKELFNKMEQYMKKLAPKADHSVLT